MKFGSVEGRFDWGQLRGMGLEILRPAQNDNPKLRQDKIMQFGLLYQIEALPPRDTDSHRRALQVIPQFREAAPAPEGAAARRPG